MIGPFSHAEWVAILTIGVGFPICGFLGFLLGTTARFHKGERGDCGRQETGP